MTWLADLSLRKKLMLISVTPTLVALLFMLGSNLVMERHGYREIQKRDLLATAKMLSFNTAVFLKYEHQLAGMTLLEATSANPRINYACILDEQGKLFSEYRRPQTDFNPNPQASIKSGSYVDSEGLHLYHPVELQGQHLGTLYLHANQEGYVALVRREQLTIIGLLLVSALIALLFAIRIQRLIYNPVTQLARAAATISRTNDYSLRVVKQGEDELGDLVDQFNEMLRRIQERKTALKREIQVREGTEQQLMAANEELQFEIGQRVQAEGQLGVLLEDLERKNAELQDFAYVVSHDLKAPLRGISSLTTWLMKDYSDTVDDKGRKYLQQLKDRTRRMHTFIEGILQYSRLGRAPMNKEILDSQQILDQVLEMLHPPPTIPVLVPDPLPMVYYDKLYLLQIFQNLVGNALQHMETPEGTITVECTCQGNDWEFSVRDTGVGIAPQHHDRIFRIFQSLKTREGDDASGIGLTLIKKIVERNGGTIRVESSPGTGSTFYFTVPIRARQDASSEAFSVFILDTNEDYTRHITKLLVNLGHRVRSATTWAHGKSVLAQATLVPDVFLLDPTHMTENLEQVLRELCLAFPDVIIIACVPETTEDAAEMAAHPSLSGIIIKPFTPEKMETILRASTHRREEEAYSHE